MLARFPHSQHCVGEDPCFRPHGMHAVPHRSGELHAAHLAWGFEESCPHQCALSVVAAVLTVSCAFVVHHDAMMSPPCGILYNQQQSCGLDVHMHFRLSRSSAIFSCLPSLSNQDSSLYRTFHGGGAWSFQSAIRMSVFL